MLFLLMVVTLLFVGCAQKEMKTKDDVDLKVFTTIYPIQFIVEEIGGDRIDVESIYPPGVDAHTYEPTTKEMIEIATGDAFIYFGPTMEGFVESAADTLEDEAVTLLSLEQYDELYMTPQADSSNSKEDIETALSDHDRNPHVWIDPLRMISIAEIITEKLIEIAPEQKQIFEQNKENVIVQLQKLDDTFQETMAGKEEKYLIVPHAAYDYWEDRYEIEQIAISGLSSSDEPSQKYLAEIIETAERYEIDYLFYEQNTPDKLIEIVKDELNAETYTIHNLAVLTEEDIENGENYLTLMEQNIEVLANAFD